MVDKIHEWPDVAALPLRSKHSLDCLIPSGVRGREVALPVDLIVGLQREPTLVAVAGVHGDEIDGIIALQRTWQELCPEKLCGTLILIPGANLPAVEASLRVGPDDGLDMNRVFPGDSQGTITEALAYHLFHDLILSADLVATFHGWSRHGTVIPYTEFPDGIGDAAVELASFEAAKAFGLGVLRVSPYRPGRLLPEAVRAGIPVIESEIGGLGIGSQENWNRYQEGLRNLLISRKMWHHGTVQPTPHVVARPVQERAPVAGMVRHLVDLNSQVEESQQLAVLTDIHGNTLAEIRSPQRALVAVQRRWPFVEAGELVCTLFVELPDYSGPPSQSAPA